MSEIEKALDKIKMEVCDFVQELEGKHYNSSHMGVNRWLTISECQIMEKIDYMLHVRMTKTKTKLNKCGDELDSITDAEFVACRLLQSQLDVLRYKLIYADTDRTNELQIREDRSNLFLPTKLLNKYVEGILKVILIRGTIQ